MVELDYYYFFSLLEGVNLLVSSGTASAIAGDRLCMVRRKTARQDDTKVSKLIKQILIGLILSPKAKISGDSDKLPYRLSQIELHHFE